MILLLLACAGGPDTAAPGDDSAAPADGPVSLTDASNYTYTIALDIGETEVAPTDELVVDWNAWSVDLRGFPVDPARDVRGIDLVWLRDLTPAEVETALVEGAITQSSVGLYATALPDPGATSWPLNRFDLYGTDFRPAEYMTQEGGSWLVRFSTETNAEAMVHFLVPGAGEPIAWIDNDSADLDFVPDLASLAPVTPGADLEVEWTGLTRDGRGGALDPLSIQELWIARYDGLDVATLQSRFFELETLAAATWTLNVYGEDGATLTDAVDATGGAFPGLSPDATWILALRCTICAAPAPVYLTVLAP